MSVKMQEEIGKFIKIEELLIPLSKIISKAIYTARLPNEIAKFTVDLSIERDKKRLSSRGGGENLFTYDPHHPSWYYLKILKKGNGVWTLTFHLPGERTVDLSNDEVLQGDEIFLEFIDLSFTNAKQPDAVSPVFWIEKRYI